MSLTERMEKWREAANGVRFFGEPVADMEKAEMAAMIGFLLEQAERLREQSRSDLRFPLRRDRVDAYGPSFNSGIGKTSDRRT